MSTYLRPTTETEDFWNGESVWSILLLVGLHLRLVFLLDLLLERVMSEGLHLPSQVVVPRFDLLLVVVFAGALDQETVTSPLQTSTTHKDPFSVV